VKQDFPCICGHIKEEHYLKEKACWFCPLIGEWCEQFVGDNLKYLENKI
jgi:hypothetical protein